jgi:hypothetical protein
MDFSGPDATDFANVRALNHAFLARLRAPNEGQSLRQQLPPGIGILVEALTNLQVERLAATPLLLFSLRERDESCWRALDSNDPNVDLFTGSSGRSDELQATAVSFLWQLAGRNPYAARLVSGASLAWCQRLAACTLLDALRTAADCPDLMRPRFADNEECWRKLLGPGLSSVANLRRSAHVTCLQWQLTDDPVAGYQRLRTAACASSAPVLSVAEKNRRA